MPKRREATLATSSFVGPAGAGRRSDAPKKDLSIRGRSSGQGACAPETPLENSIRRHRPACPRPCRVCANSGRSQMADERVKSTFAAVRDQLRNGRGSARKQSSAGDCSIATRPPRGTRSPTCTRRCAPRISAAPTSWLLTPRAVWWCGCMPARTRTRWWAWCCSTAPTRTSGCASRRPSPRAVGRVRSAHRHKPDVTGRVPGSGAVIYLDRLYRRPAHRCEACVSTSSIPIGADSNRV